MSLAVAVPWFEAQRIAPGVTLIAEPHVHPVFSANVFLVEGRDRDMVVDAGMGVAPLRPVVEALRADRDKPLILALTHAHVDHMGGAHEFEDRRVHEAEVETLADPGRAARLMRDALPRRLIAIFEEAGLGPVPPVLLDALPRPGFDPEAWRATGTTPTALLAEGDRIDLGDRSFEVLHLPGHSPGQIGLWDAEDGTLFSGDAIYEGALLPFHDIPAYLETLARLAALPATVVHGGHGPAIGRDRLRAICAEWTARWGG